MKNNKSNEKAEKKDINEENVSCDKEEVLEDTEKSSNSQKEATFQEKTSEEKKEDEIFALNSKVEELQTQNATLKDQMARRQAELENYRKRLVRDKEEAVQFANAKLLEEILPFLDNLDRALSAAKAGGDVANLVQGIEMAQSQLLANLDKNWGLKVIDSVGKEFDPQVHEACMVTVDNSLENETVLEDFLKGYTLHGRILRPSKVRIGKPE